MGSHSEIDFVFMFCSLFLHYRVVYHCFSYVICNQPCPYFLFHNMCHVIIRTIATVADIDIFSSTHNIAPVNDITESTEFIFAADWLYQCIRVSMGIQIIESIQMHAVDTVGRVARATVVVC